MPERGWIPLSEAIQGKAAAEWVEWIETERQNGARCLRCLRRFVKDHFIPVNCRPCWDALGAEAQRSAPIAVHETMAVEDEYRYQR